MDETDWEECKLDLHHIFPKKWCDDNEKDPKQYNSILNKTPISYKANRMIGGKAPSDYLKQIQNHKTVGLNDAAMDDLLSTHLISPNCLRKDDFESFLEARREMFIEKISQVMGKPVVTTGESITDDEDFTESDDE